MRVEHGTEFEFGFLPFAIGLAAGDEPSARGVCREPGAMHTRRNPEAIRALMNELAKCVFGLGIALF